MGSRIDQPNNPPEIARVWELFCDGDPVAFDRLFSLLLNPVCRQTRIKFPHVPEADVEDVASRAFTFLALNPSKYDPARSSLLTFLVLVARRRLIDTLRKQKKEFLDDPVSVADGDSGANRGRGNAPGGQRDFQTDIERDALDRIWFAGGDPLHDYPPEIERWLADALPDPRDRALFERSAEGNLSVAEFAALFDAGHLSVEEQQREMKRNRDRVQKKIKRRKSGLVALLNERFEW